jgi:hypothetical protein
VERWRNSSMIRSRRIRSTAVWYGAGSRWKCLVSHAWSIMPRSYATQGVGVALGDGTGVEGGVGGVEGR